MANQTKIKMESIRVMSTVNDLGMTDAEFAAMFDSMTPEEREAFLKFYG